MNIRLLAPVNLISITFKQHDMKKLVIYGLGLFAFSGLLSCAQAPESDNATTTEAQEVATVPTEGETWSVDITTSQIIWVGTKVTGAHSGPLVIKSGDLMVQNGEVKGGKFVFDMTRIAATGPAGSNEAMNAKLTDHLRSSDFFDVTNFPEATFEITSVTPFSGTAEPEVESDASKLQDVDKYRVAAPTHTVSGNLTLKNITKNIEFPAQINVSGTSVDAQAKFNIDRLQWDVKYPGKPDDLIRNEIHLGLSLKASK